MNPALTFYTHPMSRGRIARWMLEETGLPYDTVVLDYGTTMKAPEYLAINPMGKVPALRHGDTVVTESAAICLYLADLVPEKRLAPAPGTPARGLYYRWILFLAGPVEALLTAKHAGALAQPASAGYGTEADVLKTLEAALAVGPYLAGDHFTAADLLMTAFLSYYMRFKLLPETEVFKRYVAQHALRPAAQSGNAKDDALLPAQPPA